MALLLRRCAGSDVHDEAVVACIRRLTDDGRLDVRVPSVGTTTAEPLALADWSAAADVGRVAMGSTGVYWEPVYDPLEPRSAVMLVDPRHLEEVPGRKTGVTDGRWIAELLQYGLLRRSFVPPRPIRELRDLTRRRSRRVRHRAAACNRIQEVRGV
jgi:transposase